MSSPSYVSKQAALLRETPLAELFLFLAVVFSPFAQAFTVPIGFPLKLSEMLGGLGVAFLIGEGRQRSFRTVGGATFGVIASALLLSAFVNQGRAVPLQDHPGYSSGFTFDIVQYTVYGLVVLLVGWYLATRLGPYRIGAAISVAVRLALAYCALQLLLWGAGQADLLTTVQGTTQLGRSYGINLPRNGPFLEGNYLGFFAGVALFICLKRNDRIGAFCALACLIYSQSTSGVIAVVGAFAVTLLIRPKGKIVAVGAFAAVVASAAVTLIPAGESLLNVQLGKLGIVTDANANANLLTYSRDSRADATNVGVQMALDNPLLGVGPGRFGAWNNVTVGSDGVPINFVYGAVRPIANNGYAQIASEVGLIAFLALVVLLLVVAFRLRRGAAPNIGLVWFVIIGFSTSPSWTALPVWIAISYLVGVAGLADTKQAADEPDADRSDADRPDADEAGAEAPDLARTAIARPADPARYRPLPT